MTLIVIVDAQCLLLRKRVFPVPSVHMHTATMSGIWHSNVLRVSITAFNWLTTTQLSFEETVAAVTCEYCITHIERQDADYFTKQHQFLRIRSARSALTQLLCKYKVFWTVCFVKSALRNLLRDNSFRKAALRNLLWEIYHAMSFVNNLQKHLLSRNQLWFFALEAYFCFWTTCFK